MMAKKISISTGDDEPLAKEDVGDQPGVEADSPAPAGEAPGNLAETAEKIPAEDQSQNDPTENPAPVAEEEQLDTGGPPVDDRPAESGQPEAEAAEDAAGPGVESPVRALAASGEASAQAAIETDQRPEPLPPINEDDGSAGGEPEDTELEQIVEDIERHDSDELLEHEDAELTAAFKPGARPSLRQRLKGAVTAWWHNKRARNLTFAGFGAFVLILLLVPLTRYFVLNSVGVRVKASVHVLDYQTQQPLKNVTVKLAGRQALTDGQGNASLASLKMGATQLIIERRGFATSERGVTLGLGSNPLGEFSIEATGATYRFVVKDWLSGKPIEKAEAFSGDASAFANEEGKIALVVSPEAIEGAKAVVRFEGYRSESFELDKLDKNERGVKLVPAKKHLFVSKRSGKYDVYKIDADGQNEMLLLAGTGTERDDIVLVPHPADEVAALVSTRDNLRNSDGFLLSALYLIDVQSGALTKLAQSERIQVIDWLGKRIVYVTVAEGASASNPRRHRLVSYDHQEKDKTDLASSNYFNDVLSAGGKIFYAPSNTYQQDQSGAKLFSVNANGGDKKTVLNGEAWNVFRTDYNRLAIATESEWYEYQLGSAAATKLLQRPASVVSKMFIDNHDRSYAVWLEERDGKGVLLLRNTKTGKDHPLETRSGLQTPAYWLSKNQVVFRVATNDETADYVINVDGGAPVKIRDVSKTSGIDSWYFY